MARMTREEFLEYLFHDNYEHLKGKRLRLTRVRVPGKEVCMAHVISPSETCIYHNLALHIGVHEGEDHTGESIGLMRFTPWEAVVVAADTAVKSANVEVGFMDRFCGSLILTGGLAEVQTTQALKGEELHYIKTQYTYSEDDTIDSPGEYAESKRFSVGLACFSFEADVVAIVQSADEPFSLFCDSSRSFIQRPLIGIITKIDSPYANIPMVRQWLINIGCERIFLINNVTREGVDELLEYLEEDEPHVTLEQAMFKQSLGLNEWDPLPEGVEYPEEIRDAR